MSILHATGNCMLAGASVKSAGSSLHPWLDFAGLFVVAVGAGGIKPCVEAFGGDQFEQRQERMLSMFFSVFYFSINAGSMFSAFATPIFRSHPCLGQGSCYPLAFGVPAALMILATVLFIAGSFWYRKPPPKDNIVGEVFRLGARAISDKIKAKERARNHWLEYFLDTHDCQCDAKCVELQKKIRKEDACHKRVMLFREFSPSVHFSASLSCSYRCPPTGVCTTDKAVLRFCKLCKWTAECGPVVPTLTFCSQVVVYPLASCCVKVTPLRKMVGGGVVSARALVVTAIVQLQVN
ncbi:low-affinity peptide transporter, partial [Aphelenchoides avenae]